MTEFLTAWWLAAAVVGLVLGSFYNVCIHRYITGQSIVFPASHCPHCLKKLKAWELVPVLSWLLLRGRCSGCKKPISPRYPIVELISGLWALLLAVKFGFTAPWLVFMVFGGMFIVASAIDFELFILPDIITLPGTVMALVASIFILGLPWKAALIGAAAGAGALWLLMVLYKRLRGVEGMGLGDVKLIALIGGLLGWQALPLVILLAAGSALVGSIVFLALRPGSREGEEGGVGRIAVPFGPFLSFGAMVFILYGHEIWHWYLKMVL